eukprot:3703688-Karenia_brevis.AAC.1
MDPALIPPCHATACPRVPPGGLSERALASPALRMITLLSDGMPMVAPHHHSCRAIRHHLPGQNYWGPY